MTDAQPELEAHVIHASLHRPILFAGAEPRVVVLEVTTAFALVFGVGLHVATVLLAVFYLTVVQGATVSVAKQHAGMIALHARRPAKRAVYATTATWHWAPSPDRPSLPHTA